MAQSKSVVVLLQARLFLISGKLKRRKGEKKTGERDLELCVILKLTPFY